MWHHPCTYRSQSQRTHKRHHRNGKIQIQKEIKWEINDCLGFMASNLLRMNEITKHAQLIAVPLAGTCFRLLLLSLLFFCICFLHFSYGEREKFALKNGLTLAFHAIGVAHGTTTRNLNRNLCALENWLTQSHCFFLGPDTVAILPWFVRLHMCFFCL